MAEKCPECGVSLDEIPFEKCRNHEIHRLDEEEALQRQLEARPLSQKIREAEHFEELRDILADHFALVEDE